MGFIIIFHGELREDFDDLDAILVFVDHISFGVGCVVIDLFEDVSWKSNIIPNDLNLSYFIHIIILLLNWLIERRLQGYNLLQLLCRENIIHHYSQVLLYLWFDIPHLRHCLSKAFSILALIDFNLNLDALIQLVLNYLISIHGLDQVVVISDDIIFDLLKFLKVCFDCHVFSLYAVLDLGQEGKCHMKGILWYVKEALSLHCLYHL